MAEIPVEKKSGTPGWLWPLLALLLGALLLWWLLSRDDDADTVQQTTVAEETVAADPALATPVAGAAAAGAAAGAFTVGQTATLQGARVTSVPGDMAFNVDANGQPMFVVFNEEASPRQPGVEGQIDVREGMTVNLEGTVRSASEPLPAGFNATIPAGTQQYLAATRIEVVQ